MLDTREKNMVHNWMVDIPLLLNLIERELSEIQKQLSEIRGNLQNIEKVID